MASLKKQALVLTLANAYTRALGFVLRLVTARLMGAEAMGVMELASSAVMLAITPVTAGVPTAMSRLTAQRGADEKAVLRAVEVHILHLDIRILLYCREPQQLPVGRNILMDILVIRHMAQDGRLLLGTDWQAEHQHQQK